MASLTLVMKGLIRLGDNGEKKQKNKKNYAMSAALAASSAKNCATFET